MADVKKLIIDNVDYDIRDDGAKRLQTAVTEPTSTTGSATVFVDSITQNSEGVISYTTKRISASIPGTAQYAEALNPGSKIDGVDYDGSSNIVHYGTTDATGTTGFSVICPGFGSSNDLAAGARIIVKFENNFVTSGAGTTMKIVANSSDTTGTGAIAIQYRSSPVLGFSAGQVVEFIYDGTVWQRVGDVNTNTTYVFDGTYDASSNKAATVSTVTTAINALDVSQVTVGASKTLASIKEENGKISVPTPVDINISASQVGSGTFDAARIPNISTDKLTAGNNPIPISMGGTQATSFTSGKVIYYSGVGLASSNTDNSKLQYINNVTSDIQQQIDAISGGGTDHIRYYNTDITFSGDPLAATVDVSPSTYIVGSKTVSAGDILIDSVGNIASVLIVASNQASIRLLATQKLKGTLVGTTLTLGVTLTPVS